MAFYYLPIRGPPLIGSLRPHLVDPNSTDLTGYRTSPNAVRYFCDGCSAHMFLYENDTNWYVAGGALERTAGIAQLGCHVHVEDTMDGGIADQLRAVGGKRLPRYANEENGKEVPLGWRANELKSREAAKQEEKLPFYCHCGAIKFDITRPNELSAQPYAPYPDLLFPTIQTRLATICNPKDEKWWLSPSMCTNETGQLITLDSRGAEEHKVAPSCGTKYLAGHCVCTHCRLGNGFEVQSWGFVPRSNIFEKGSSKPIEFMNEKARPRGLKQFSSSPGKYTEFCGTCGATAFWWYSGRQDVIDVSLGLLDERVDGVRAEEWLKWHKKRLSFVEKAGVSIGTIQGLMEGMANFEDPDEKN